MLESIRRETILESDLNDLDFPEGSLIIMNTFSSSGEEVSVLRVVGGNLFSPITAKVRMHNHASTKSATITFVNIVTGVAKVVTLPENRATTSIKLEPLLTETPDSVKLEPISNSMLRAIFQG